MGKHRASPRRVEGRTVAAESLMVVDAVAERLRRRKDLPLQ